MPIKYNLVEFKNPSHRERAGKYYAVASDSDPITIDEIARKIEQSSSLSQADIHGALVALTQEVADNLLNGNTVHLGKLGSLRATLNSKGVARKQDFTNSMIEGVKIRFTASKDLKQALVGVQYKNITTPEVKPKVKSGQAG